MFFRLIVNAQISFDERTAILFAKTRVGFSLPVSCAADDPSKHPFAQLLKKSGEREREREREMGIIEGGTVAGIVPDERFFAVNYPGYPSSLARATHTLGGEETIAKVKKALTFLLASQFASRFICLPSISLLNVLQQISMCQARAHHQRTTILSSPQEFAYVHHLHNLCICNRGERERERVHSCCIERKSLGLSVTSAVRPWCKHTSVLGFIQCSQSLWSGFFCSGNRVHNCKL